MRYNEYTIAIETKKGILDYLIITLPDEKISNDEFDDIVLNEFELYKNDEAGEHLKDDELESYGIVRKDTYDDN